MEKGWFCQYMISSLSNNHTGEEINLDPYFPPYIETSCRTFLVVQWIRICLPGEGTGSPLQCSCLENPRDGEPGGLPSVGLHRVRYSCSDLAAKGSDRTPHQRCLRDAAVFLRSSPHSLPGGQIPVSASCGEVKGPERLRGEAVWAQELGDRAPCGALREVYPVQMAAQSGLGAQQP